MYIYVKIRTYSTVTHTHNAVRVGLWDAGSSKNSICFFYPPQPPMRIRISFTIPPHQPHFHSLLSSHRAGVVRSVQRPGQKREAAQYPSNHAVFLPPRGLPLQRDRRIPPSSFLGQQGFGTRLLRHSSNQSKAVFKVRTVPRKNPNRISLPLCLLLPPLSSSLDPRTSATP